MSGKALLVLGALAQLAASALFTDVSQLKKSTYDFVIIGGALLATRHSSSNEAILSSGHSGECPGVETDRESLVLCPGY